MLPIKVEDIKQNCLALARLPNSVPIKQSISLKMHTVKNGQSDIQDSGGGLCVLNCHSMR